MTTTVVMRFGKHKGVAVRDIDDGYLAWLLLQDWIHDDLRNAVAAEVHRRQTPKRKKKSKRPVQELTRIVKLRWPYAAVHPIPADVVLDATEECPFDVPETLDDLDVEHMAIVRDEMNGSPRH